MYQMISLLTAEELSEAKMKEDNLALHVLPSGTKLKIRTKRAHDSDYDIDSNDSDYDIDSISGKYVPLAGISTEKTPMIKAEEEEYEAEKKQGDMADLFGTNQHHSYPEIYKDLGRRFVPQYPYMEVTDYMDKNPAEKDPIPIRASPELVLAVAAKSAVLEAAKPHDYLAEKQRNKEILRSGNYWDSVWREDVDPVMLRTQKEEKIKFVKVKVMQGSKLYNLVTELKKISPRLVYLINKKQKD